VSVISPPRVKRVNSSYECSVFYFFHVLLPFGGLLISWTICKHEQHKSDSYTDSQLCQMVSAIAASLIGRSSMWTYNAYQVTMEPCLKYLSSKCFQHAPVLPGKHINQLRI